MMVGAHTHSETSVPDMMKSMDEVILCFDSQSLEVRWQSEKAKRTYGTRMVGSAHALLQWLETFEWSDGSISKEQAFAQILGLAEDDEPISWNCHKKQRVNSPCLRVCVACRREGNPARLSILAAEYECSSEVDSHPTTPTLSCADTRKDTDSHVSSLSQHQSQEEPLGRKLRDLEQRVEEERRGREQAEAKLEKMCGMWTLVLSDLREEMGVEIDGSVFPKWQAADEDERKRQVAQIVRTFAKRTQEVQTAREGARRAEQKEKDLQLMLSEERSRGEECRARYAEAILEMDDLRAQIDALQQQTKKEDERQHCEPANNPGIGSRMASAVELASRSASAVNASRNTSKDRLECLLDDVLVFGGASEKIQRVRTLEPPPAPCSYPPMTVVSHSEEEEAAVEETLARAASRDIWGYNLTTSHADAAGADRSSNAEHAAEEDEEDEEDAKVRQLREQVDQILRDRQRLGGAGPFASLHSPASKRHVTPPALRSLPSSRRTKDPPTERPHHRPPPLNYVVARS